jgi:proline dehydrogenase
MARLERTYDGERMTAFVGFYVTPTAFAELKAAAAQQAATMSDFAREALLRRLGTPPMIGGARRDPRTVAMVQALDRAAFESSALGNNLNQIARVANTTGELSPALVRDLDGLIALIAKAAAMHIAALDAVLECPALGRAAEAA